MSSVVLAAIILFHLRTACSRGTSPVIVDDSMGDTIALLGQDVDFTCKVENVGKHMVAFVKSDSPPRLISFDETIFRKRTKYELKPRMGPLNNEWILTIKNAQESDKGNYSCQINTEPIVSKTAALEIKMPPAVSRNTPSAVEVREGHNVTLDCTAYGNPTPTVIWRRQDRQIIRYNGATGFGASVFHGSSLQLTKVNRRHMSEYVCVATNGIPPDESWTVKLLVTFPPLVHAQSNEVVTSLGAVVRLACTSESWPRPDFTWEKDNQPITDSNHYSITQSVSGQYHTVHVLEIRRVQPHHFGTYRCIAKNDYGIHHDTIVLKRDNTASYLYTNAIPEGSGLKGSADDDEDSDETASIVDEDGGGDADVDGESERRVSAAQRHVDHHRHHHDQQKHHHQRQPTTATHSHVHSHKELKSVLGNSASSLLDTSVRIALILLLTYLL